MNTNDDTLALLLNERGNMKTPRHLPRGVLQARVTEENRVSAGRVTARDAARSTEEGEPHPVGARGCDGCHLVHLRHDRAVL